MPRRSAGILLYRRDGDDLHVLLVHPGGPYFARKDAGAWTVPKGEIDDGEEPLATARRELLEEIDREPDGPFVPLGSVRQKGGKVVEAWAAEVPPDFAPGPCRSTVEIEWPPRSGRRQAFPEVDRVEFVELDEARRLINPAQEALLDRLIEIAG